MHLFKRFQPMQSIIKVMVESSVSQSENIYKWLALKNIIYDDWVLYNGSKTWKKCNWFAVNIEGPQQLKAQTLINLMGHIWGYQNIGVALISLVNSTPHEYYLSISRSLILSG